MKKTTKAQKNMDIIAMLKGEAITYGTTLEEAIAHLEKENDLLTKKSSGERKPTTRQQENDKLREIVLDWLSQQTEGKTVTDMMKEIPELDGLTNQRVAAIVKPLKDAEIIDKKVEKGRSYFYKK